MADFENIIYEVEDNTGWITLNRPERLNALSTPLLEELEQALNAAKEDDDSVTDLLRVRPVKKTLAILVTPDRGLAGALVGNLQRAAGVFIQETEGDVSVIGVGRKGERFITRTGNDLMAAFSVPDRPRLDDTVAISRMLMDEYSSQRVDRVVLIYARFVNTAVQTVTVQQLLPVEPPQRGEGDVEKLEQLDYIYEPSISEVLASLVPRYVETEVYHGILEAIASEHSARMIAMQNATDNANEIVEELTLDMNKARQESITAELLDIVGGVAALEG
jgi:F-type H+-transporting ATPase subunit gamma